ncbi:hypothetical protein [Massilia sp. S19_KUP03_FR1]|uniref:hypothetical protein n=1 Tax=Massilia sp. S19_KUP03_FR1 TaxID=3025503 RepID=UPI002FCD8D42
MATKPRAVKAPIKAVASKRAVASTPKVAVKTAAKAPARPAAKPVTKVASKPLAKASVKAVVKPAVKATVKPAAKPVAKRAPALPVALKRAAKAVAAAPLPAAGNPSLVRDSFTMPEAEYAVFASAKLRCLQAGVEVKKSELLRIGMALVGQLDVATLQAVLSGLPQLKTGRPRSE